MESNRLTTQEFWENTRAQNYFKRQDAGHGIDEFIKKYVPVTDQASVIEIGSYPGPHLATFGDLGYELNGVDFCKDNAVGLPGWLKNEGFKVGQFEACDFFEYKQDRLFDVVCSFGFIEHFNNYEEIIIKHALLVKPQGYLVITTPNFRGLVQYLLHKYFDENNLALHNVKSMCPDKWSELLSDMGYEIKYAGYFGGFWFWRGEEQLSYLKRKILWLLERVIPRLRKLLWFESSFFSAYCGIVAVKK